MLPLKSRTFFSVVALSVGLVCVSPAGAQLVVYDPTNYASNVLQAARALEQVNNQIQSLSNEATMLISMSDPLADIGKRSVTVTIASAVRASKTSFQVKWMEQVFESGSLVSTIRWTALLGIRQKTPTTADTLRKNPLGLGSAKSRRPSFASPAVALPEAAMTDQAPPEKVDPETLVLRAKPRSIIRIKRNLLIALAGGGCICVAGLAWLGLNPLALQPVTVASSDKDPEKHKASLPDQVAALPKSYDQTPVLGEKLPGDLGRPILEHRRAHGIAAREGPTVGKLAGRADDARTSGLFFQVGGAAGGERSSISANRALSAEQTLMALSSPFALASASPGSGGSGQAERIGFLQGANRDGAVDRHRVQAPTSANMVMAGTVIRASLITGLNSDVPGFVLAQVTSDVTDSRTGRLVLIPQGARLIGKYDSTIAFGQSRAIVIWQRLLWPDGRSLEIDNTPASDIGGNAGLTDRVDFHTASLLKGIGLSTLLGVSGELGRNSDDDLVEALRRSVQETSNEAGQKIVSRELDVQPNITVRPGWPIRVIVQKDLVLDEPAPGGQP